MIKIQCPMCGNCSSSTPEWIGKNAECPYCHSCITITPQSTLSSDGLTNKGMIFVCVASIIGVLLLFSSVVFVLRSLHSSPEKRIQTRYNFEREHETEQAKRFVDDLPEEQARFLRSGYGSSSDKANFYANFSEADPETKRAIINSLERGDL